MNQPNTVNNGFWDLHPEDRASAMEAACQRGDSDNFFDLSPEERAEAYDRATGGE